MKRLFGFLIVVNLGLEGVEALSNKVPQTGFSCKGRPTGYYADVESGCQVYHMCDGLGRQFSYTCPNATLFQQRMLICDHWYMVNCSKSVGDYTANLRIGHKEMPFVDDSESNPYHRTPRPDLLSHPNSQSELDIIYRTGRAQFGTNLNLVGAESDSKNSTSTSTTDEPAYSLPSHWSTEYSSPGLSTTVKPLKPLKKILDAKINTAGEVANQNFKSYFKATTPVYPKSVEINSEAPDQVGLLPPLPYQLSNSTNGTNEPKNEPLVNFPSQFRATTPVYPKVVDAQPKSGSSSVNFQSEFKATTPVYPKSVDITSEEPGDLGILPPVDGTTLNGTSDGENRQVPTLSLDFEPPAVESNYKRDNRSEELNEAVPPSKFYQPPKFEPDYTELSNEEENLERRGGFKALNSEEWEDLRKKFLIPDYEFPLESVSRPSYDTVLTSFQAGKVPSESEN